MRAKPWRQLVWGDFVWLLHRMWSWTVAGILCSVAWGAAMSVSGSDFTVAECLFIGGNLLAFLKFYSWKELRGRRRLPLILLAIIGVLVISAVEIKFVEKKRASFEATKRLPHGQPQVVVPPPAQPNKTEIISKSLKTSPPTVAPQPPISIRQHSEGPNSPNIVAGAINIGTDRLLTEDQIAELAQSLEKFKSQPVIIRTLFFDSEASRYARDFEKAFKRAGWDIKGFGLGDKVPSGTESGLWLGVKDPARQPPGAIALGDILVKRFHLQVRGMQFTDVEENHIYFIVGEKPRP